MSGDQWVDVLLVHPKLAEHCDWSRLPGSHWSSLLSARPQFADFCSWEKLSRDERALGHHSCWPELLVAQPQFSGKCDWDSIEADGWGTLLRRRPEFADKCDWSFVAGVAHRDLCELLCKRPQFLDKIKWQNFTGLYLVQLLSEAPRLIGVCDYNRLSGEAWTELVCYRPEFVDRCDWAKVNEALRDKAWKTMLERRSQLAKFRKPVKMSPMVCEKICMVWN